MKITSSIIQVLLGCFVALALPARAQLQTFETVSGSEGSVTTFSTDKALIQTFANLSLVQSMTYRFASTSGSNFAGTTLNAYFTEWNPTTNTSIGAAFSSSSVSVPNFNSFTTYSTVGGDYRGFDYQFTLNQVTDPTKTYAMVLVGTAPTSIGLLNIDTVDQFSFGDNRSRSGISSFSSLATAGPTQSPGFDWGFSQIAVTPYAASPVPEPQTAAAVIAVLFVAGLVGRRIVQRRQAALQPLQA